ncbi:unnamed protein product [Tilletia laevis]|nr:unnamed protein product [Tilletia laevis]
MAAVPQQELAQRNDKVKLLDECLHGIGDGQAAVHHEATNPNPFASATHDVESSGASNSVSAFPKASRRSNFVWRADNCGILCFAHHLNIAIRDAFNAMGIKFAAQMKVIPIPEIVEPELDPNLGFFANPDAADEGGMDTTADSLILPISTTNGQKKGSIPRLCPNTLPLRTNVAEKTTTTKIWFSSAQDRGRSSSIDSGTVHRKMSRRVPVAPGRQ